MQTREELLNGLGEAADIIRQLVNIQQKLNNTRAKYRSLIPPKPQKGLSIIKIILGFIGISIIGTIVFSIVVVASGDMSVENTVQKGALFLFVPYLSIPLEIFNNKKRNKKIEEQNKLTQQQNEQLLAFNERVKEEEQGVLNELQQLQVVYNKKVNPWYPIDYCSLEAVEFLYNAINNYRADSLKEAVNLYETTLHQQRVESNQQQALKQQKLNNLLSAGSLVIQGATLGAINDQTAAINNQTASLTNGINNINDNLNRIRRGY